MRKCTSKNEKSRLPRLAGSYLALIKEFPLRPIRTEAAYRAAEKIIHRLALREGKLEQAQEEYLQVLEALTGQFEQERYSVDVEGVSSTEALRMLVSQSGMTVTDLGELLGSKGAASELLSGRRKEPSKSQIAKLCHRFNVDAGVFLNIPRTRRGAA